MGVLDFRPHRLYLYSESASGYEDEDGLWHNGGQGTFEKYLQCNAVPSGQPNVITYEDGTTDFYEYTIIVGKKCTDLVKGNKIKVVFWEGKSNSYEKEFTVKGFQRYQHQCKIWV